jgi:predicted nucleotidyltransferase
MNDDDLEMKLLAAAINGRPFDFFADDRKDPNWIPAGAQAEDAQSPRESEVLVVGDVHGRYEELNRLIRVLKPKMVLQCGDFGYFPRLDYMPKDGGETIYPFEPQGKIENGNVPVHFCDGNHEDHEALAKFNSKTPTGHEVAPSVFYQERGSTITLPDGRVVLFMGGAESIDRHRRTEGRDWFPGELLTEADLASLPDCKVDIVISHTLPAVLGFFGDFDSKSHRYKQDDPSRLVLDKVFYRYRPSYWYFGHWHHTQGRTVQRTHFQGLDQVTHAWNWTWLPEILPVLDFHNREAVLRKLAKLCAESHMVMRAYAVGSYACGDCTAKSALRFKIEFDDDSATHKQINNFIRMLKESFDCPAENAYEIEKFDDENLPPTEENLLVYEAPDIMRLDREKLKVRPHRKRNLMTDDWQKVLGGQVRSLREKLGRSLEDTAARALVKPEVLRRLEAGGDVPLRVLINVLWLFGCAEWIETLPQAAREYAPRKGDITSLDIFGDDEV